MTERFEKPAGPAWLPLTDAGYDHEWAKFKRRYGFRASTTSDGWPAISEPPDSMTFDLSVVEDGPRRAAAYDALNSEALRCFVWALEGVDELVVLDWQHQTYRFRPSRQAMTCRGEWAVSVHPDGDYFAFMTPDMSEGTFGHPWEQTLCVIGERLVSTLGKSLATWLPLKRAGGVRPV